MTSEDSNVPDRAVDEPEAEPELIEEELIIEEISIDGMCGVY
jgi:mycofactocin precursor